MTYFALTQEEAMKYVKYFSEGDVILVKASRAEHLDELSEMMIGELMTRAQGEEDQ